MTYIKTDEIMFERYSFFALQINGNASKIYLKHSDFHTQQNGLKSFDITAAAAGLIIEQLEKEEDDFPMRRLRKRRRTYRARPKKKAVKKAK